MIRICTPSRLHFGLFSVPGAQPSCWTNQQGEVSLPRRSFGGVGLMIEQPGIDLSAARSSTWSAEGPLAGRALLFAQRYCKTIGIQDGFHLRILSAAPEHAGLGTGTQLGLAVARALAELTGQPARDAVHLAAHVGRGLRSSLGVHGFEHGGLLVEGGKTTEAGVAPLLVRCDFPEEWGVLLVLAPDLQGTHGSHEIAAFADLANQARQDRITETLCRLVLLGLLPALCERDLCTFGEALYDFNRRVGEMFQPVQGGLYAHPCIEDLVAKLRAAGVKAVGQSSWGPTVFAIAPVEQLTHLRDWLSRTHADLILTRGRNQGAKTVLSTEY